MLISSPLAGGFSDLGRLSSNQATMSSSVSKEVPNRAFTVSMFGGMGTVWGTPFVSFTCPRTLIVKECETLGAGELDWKITCVCMGQSLRIAWPTPWPGDTWCERCGPHTGRLGCRARRCSRSSSPQCAPSCQSPGRRDRGENWPAISITSELMEFFCLFSNNSPREAGPHNHQVVLFFQPVQTPGTKHQMCCCV